MRSNWNSKARATVWRNEGFWGIHVVNGQTYKLSFWIKGSPAYKGVLTAELQTEGGQSLGSRELTVDVGSEWTKLTAEITATGEAREGWFALKGSVPGTVVLDVVSLFPPTYKGRATVAASTWRKAGSHETVVRTFPWRLLRGRILC